MRPAQPLPAYLQDTVFALSQLRREGLSAKRVERRDVVRVGSGLYALRSVVAEADEEALYRMRSYAVVRDCPGTWLSHVTAARVMRAPLPGRLYRDPAVHLSLEKQKPRIQRAGVRAHRITGAAHRAVTLPGSRDIRLTGPEWLFLELAPLCSLEELVAVGDWLVREPRHWAERRDLAYSTPEDLRKRLDTAGRVPGKLRAREALDLVRVGADSPKETAFRLALIRAGLPEPELQVRLEVLGPVTRYADAAYPEYRIAIQYDGAGHFTPQQARADQRRDNEFVAAGWLVLRFNVADDRECYVSAVAQVRAALLSRGWPP